MASSMERRTIFAASGERAKDTKQRQLPKVVQIADRLRIDKPLKVFGDVLCGNKLAKIFRKRVHKAVWYLSLMRCLAGQEGFDIIDQYSMQRAWPGVLRSEA